MRKRERENPCGICGHYHKYEAGEVCGICGHRIPEPTEKSGGFHVSAFPSEILPEFLYLGSYDNASRCELLKTLGISRVLNTVPTCQNLYKNSFTYHCLADEKPLPFDDAIQFLEQCDRDNARVLVHCMSGKSRSPAIVIAYLMKCKGWRLAQSCQWVKDRRPIVDLSSGAYEQLQEYERHIFGSSESSLIPTGSPLSPTQPFGVLKTPLSPTQPFGVQGTTLSPTQPFGVQGTTLSPTQPYGVLGTTSSPTQPSGVLGITLSPTPRFGVLGTTPRFGVLGTTPRFGVLGTTPRFGVLGTTPRFGVLGTTPRFGVLGTTPRFGVLGTTPRFGVLGTTLPPTQPFGVLGTTLSPTPCVGVLGTTLPTTHPFGVLGTTSSPTPRFGVLGTTLPPTQPFGFGLPNPTTYTALTPAFNTCPSILSSEPLNVSPEEFTFGAAANNEKKISGNALIFSEHGGNDTPMDSS